MGGEGAGRVGIGAGDGVGRFGVICAADGGAHEASCSGCFPNAKSNGGETLKDAESSRCEYLGGGSECVRVTPTPAFNCETGVVDISSRAAARRSSCFAESALARASFSCLRFWYFL